MSNNVYSLNGATPAGHPVPEIIETLEILLGRAKSGEIQGLAYAASHAFGDGFSNGWEANGGQRDQLGSAIAHLNSRYFAGYDE